MVKETKLVRPSEILIINLGENKTKELFISSGLLRVLVGLCNPTGELGVVLPMILSSNPEIQNQVLENCIADRDKKGKILTTKEDLEGLVFNLSSDESNKILNLVGEHLSYFLYEQTLNLNNESTKKMIAQIQGLNQ